MVFQNYAVFPNLTVAGNVAYGLRARKVATAEIERRVEEALGPGPALQATASRWPHQLGRPTPARRYRPRAGDPTARRCCSTSRSATSMPGCRVSMRTEIRDLQKSLGITAIYVTHDQEEAMSVSDRLALMNAGRLEQVGVPVDIYRHPGVALRRRVHGHDQSRAGPDGGAPAISSSHSDPRPSAALSDAAQGLAGAVGRWRMPSCWDRSCAST